MAETSSSQRPWWKASLSPWVRTKGGTAEEVSIVVAIAAIGAFCVRLGSCVEQSTSTSECDRIPQIGRCSGSLAQKRHRFLKELSDSPFDLPAL